ncbi:MAG: CDP-diacylglycerol--glycerol-3-phosphate 3-phosphatidyltransferase [Desulfobacteraceae bacterium]|jgi:cardiolipin synthase
MKESPKTRPLPINIPNTLTVIRILLTPLFVICLLREMFIPALLVFSFAGISDGLDGFIARYFNQRTVLGAYLDPVADKLLLLSAFICLAILHVIPEWLTVLVISRDVVILIGMVSLKIFDVAVEIKPSMVSKLTTVSQLLTVFVVLLNPVRNGFGPLSLTLFWVTAALTVASGLHYTYVGLKFLHADAD